MAKGKVFIERARTAKGIWKSPGQRERTRLNMASRLHLARGVCKGGENSRGQRIERIAQV